MSVLAIDASDATRTLVEAATCGRELGFQRDVDALADHYSALWVKAPRHTPCLGEPIPRRRKWRNHRLTKRLIRSLSGRIEDWPEDEEARLSLKSEIKAQVQRYGEETLGWPKSYRDLVFGDDFYQTTVEFSQRARAFDRGIVPADLGQALRNVWIMNSVQMLLDLEVGISPSMFAYSMLYPYTDNYLDDPDVPVTAKRLFNVRLEQRLRGRMAPERIRDSRLRSIFRLIDMIDDEHPRDSRPQVHLSLLAIHEAQIESLRQQSRDHRPGPEDLVALSVRKGGASVLADGYLVDPQLAPAEADFFFGYGVFLQFLDDLQDVENDHEAGHATLFSTAIGDRPLDGLASRLFHFMQEVLGESPRFVSASYNDRKDLIRRNCTFLLVGAIADNHSHFSGSFLRRLETGWPLAFSSMRRLRKFASKRQKKTARVLRRRHAVGSLLELLD